MFLQSASHKQNRGRVMKRFMSVFFAVMLIAAATFAAVENGGAKECCKAKQECCKAKKECCKAKKECCAKPECCKKGAECCKKGAECCKKGADCCK